MGFERVLPLPRSRSCADNSISAECFQANGKATAYLPELVEAMGLEPTNLLTASQALYQLSYAPSGEGQR